MQIRWFAVCLLSAFLTAAAAPAAFAQGWIVAEGGGNDNQGPWAERLFRLLVERGGSGSAVVLAAVEWQEDPRPELLRKLGAKSSTKFVVDQTAAQSGAAAKSIEAARVVWIAGGDQSRYVNWWRNTAIENAIRSVAQKQGVVGGTRAGCAILGEWTYDAQRGSLSPREILKDARHGDLTLTRGFLGLVPGVLFDTHFTERGRLPRMAVMLASINIDHGQTPVCYGVDPRTALVVGPDGIGEVIGEGTVTVLRWTDATSARLEPGKPPSIRNMSYARLAEGAKVEVKTGRVTARPAGVRPREASTWPMLAEPLTVTGSDAPAPTVDGAAISTQTFEPRMVWEHLVVVGRALARGGSLGILLDEQSSATLTGDSLSVPAESGAAVVVIDARLADQAAVIRDDRRGPVHLENATLHLLAPGETLEASPAAAPANP